ncbi:hypothetical protein AGMMS49573_10270 [Endomicrobiia bacterium]|nr:hypothetical protein AGMMS49573_10270 [Endomicrobiia bacterium]
MTNEEAFAGVFGYEFSKIVNKMKEQGLYPDFGLWEEIIKILQNVDNILGELETAIQISIKKHQPYFDCMIAMINSVESSVRGTHTLLKHLKSHQKRVIAYL